TAPEFHSFAAFPQRPQRKTPAPKGARVYRRMGEGLGAGGHSTRRYCLNAEAAIQFLRLKLFANLAPPGQAPPPRARPGRPVDRQCDMAAIRKLQISQPDAKTALPAAAALDHIARADREPAGETVCTGTHEYPPESKKNHVWELSSSNVRTPRRFRDSLATGRDFCESLWTRSVSRTRAFRGQSPGGTNSRTPRGLFRRLMPGASRPSAPNRGPRRAP